MFLSHSLAKQLNLKCQSGRKKKIARNFFLGGGGVEGGVCVGVCEGIKNNKKRRGEL